MESWIGHICKGYKSARLIGIVSLFMFSLETVRYDLKLMYGPNIEIKLLKKPFNHTTVFGIYGWSIINFFDKKRLYSFSSDHYRLEDFNAKQVIIKLRVTENPRGWKQEDILGLSSCKQVKGRSSGNQQNGTFNSGYLSLIPGGGVI